MCYGTCKYEYHFGPASEMSGECSIYKLLGTEQMPDDATCVNPIYEGDGEIGNIEVQDAKS